MSSNLPERLEQFDVFPLPLPDVYYDSSFNCRGEFTLDSVRDLADSIKENGLAFPVVVQPAEDCQNVPDGYEWRLIAGHRRYQAIKFFLRWPTIPASIRRGLTPRQARVLNLTENLERKDLNPLEEAIALGKLYPEGIPLRAAAREIKRSTQWVKDRIRLLKMPTEIQQMVASKRLTLVDVQTIYQRSEEQWVETALAIIDSRRQAGPKKSRIIRTIKMRKRKCEISSLIKRLFDLGLDGLVTRVAAWCAGYVSDDELEIDIQQECATRGLLYRKQSNEEFE